MSMVFRISSHGEFRVHALTFPMCLFNFSDLADHHLNAGPDGIHAVPRSSPIATKQTRQYSLYSMNACAISKVSPSTPSERRRTRADRIQSRSTRGMHSMFTGPPPGSPETP